MATGCHEMESSQARSPKLLRRRPPAGSLKFTVPWQLRLCPLVAVILHNYTIDVDAPGALICSQAPLTTHVRELT
jgi:hypothetical protein